MHWLNAIKTKKSQKTAPATKSSL